MLEIPVRIEFIMTRQVNLSVLGSNFTFFVNQNCSVVPVGMIGFYRQLSITQVKGHIRLSRHVEQRLSVRAWHFRFEPLINLTLIRHIPSREKSSESEFRKHHQVTPFLFGSAHQRYHALDDARSAFGFLNWAQLCCAYC